MLTERLTTLLNTWTCLHCCGHPASVFSFQPCRVELLLVVASNVHAHTHKHTHSCFSIRESGLMLHVVCSFHWFQLLQMLSPLALPSPMHTLSWSRTCTPRNCKISHTPHQPLSHTPSQPLCSSLSLSREWFQEKLLKEWNDSRGWWGTDKSSQITTIERLVHFNVHFLSNFRSKWISSTLVVYLLELFEWSSKTLNKTLNLEESCLSVKGFAKPIWRRCLRALRVQWKIDLLFESCVQGKRTERFSRNLQI